MTVLHFSGWDNFRSATKRTLLDPKTLPYVLKPYLVKKPLHNESEIDLTDFIFFYFRQDFPAAWMNLGIILASTKRLEEAEIAYNTALQYRKVYPDCFYNLGNLVSSFEFFYLALFKVGNLLLFYVRYLPYNSYAI